MAPKDLLSTRVRRIATVLSLPSVLFHAFFLPTQTCPVMVYDWGERCAQTHPSISTWKSVNPGTFYVGVHGWCFGLQLWGSPKWRVMAIRWALHSETPDNPTLLKLTPCSVGIFARSPFMSEMQKPHVTSSYWWIMKYCLLYTQGNIWMIAFNVNIHQLGRVQVAL